VQSDQTSLPENHIDSLEPEIVQFIHENCQSDHSSKLVLLKTNTRFNIEVLQGNNECIINLARLNDIRWINKFIETVNQKLNPDGIFICCGETVETRKEKFTAFHSKFVLLFLFPFDFLYKRVLPKLPGIKKIYFILTQGHNRVMSKAEILGRLISCGFKIEDVRKISNKLYFSVKKIQKPAFDKQVSYGPLFKMRRVGKDKKIIHVYKFRTMYPFSEYLQEYITEQNNLQKSGKIANDYRITSWGRVFRMIWIDELPMLFNWMKGDLKLFGVRPLSQTYFNLYPPHLQNLRTKTKPGLVPPFYVDLPKSWEEILQSEERYLNAYFKYPLRTDMKYFFKALNNIVFKGRRSE
jgi:lipopolysaccharide/colanic/teichoic acid biosynthesis glycosyltransferase